MCIFLEKEGYIKVLDDKYVITKNGKKFLELENKKLNKKGIDKNIGILNKYIIEKMDEDEIFIPREIKF